MILSGGPYKLFDHYLAVQPWEPGFNPTRAKAPKTAIWVKLHGVPIVCFYEVICLYLGSKIGKPIKVDPTTLLATQGKFAQVCIEVDLSQQLPSSVDLDLEELPQSLILVENLEKSPPVNNPSARAIIELSQTLKPEAEENNMAFAQPDSQPNVSQPTSDPTNPPPAPSKDFVKPNSKRKKTRDPKPPMQKPYEPPPTFKKQQDSSIQPPLVKQMDPTYMPNTTNQKECPTLAAPTQHQTLLVKATNTSQYQVKGDSSGNSPYVTGAPLNGDPSTPVAGLLTASK
ncbi:hypothetical protein SLEP1_g12387 [Rubroshorea leprosula]|uniref:DUF4283 domain-containing protein n=1 Tax=Rubroshorea leprosula TaxID=152421 RepID=A0AAV5ICC8_9ROSI|nr:hypothetical protein SLEP1_g12387 [Rubroshorea leprosula]